jgi:hypothetical protein
VLKLADGKTAAYISGSGTETLAFKAPTAADVKTLETKGGMILASAASAKPRCIADSLKIEK